MSFIYPRTITIKRPGVQSGVGAITAYASDQETTETVVATGIRASIQAKSTSGKNPVGLPSDVSMQTWRVMTPKSALGAGVVQNGDIVVDDLGNRYQVQADYRNSLGANFIVSRLEA